MEIPSSTTERARAPLSKANHSASASQPIIKINRPNKGKLYTNVLSTLKVTTLAVILIAALRVLVYPKPLSDEEMRFLWWALGTAVTMLGATTAASRK